MIPTPKEGAPTLINSRTLLRGVDLKEEKKFTTDFVTKKLSKFKPVDWMEDPI